MTAEVKCTMRQELITADLATVEAHFHSEAADEAEQALEFFNEGIA
jgi:hypothetical protein